MKKTLLTLAILAVAFAAQADDCYSSGIRIGTIQKFSQKGLVNKSWEGELVMQGEKIKGNANGIRGGNVWAFSVLEPAVAASIEAGVMSGGQIALKYCEASPLNPIKGFSTNTPYRITMAVVQK